MAKITIQDIKGDMEMTSDVDAFYFDSLNNVGYHMHVTTNGSYIFMKNDGKKISPITEEEFINAVNNDCYGNSIGADSYYIFDEIPKPYTYDIVFNSDESSGQKGFKASLEYCKDYIRTYNGTNESYFANYKGGIVEIVCNETEETVYSEEVK